jgi:hypothetical protein
MRLSLSVVQKWGIPVPLYVIGSIGFSMAKFQTPSRSAKKIFFGPV